MESFRAVFAQLFVETATKDGAPPAMCAKAAETVRGWGPPTLSSEVVVHTMNNNPDTALLDKGELGELSPTVELVYLERWPLEMRLGVLRLLRDLGWLQLFREHDPETVKRLVAKLRGDD